MCKSTYLASPVKLPTSEFIQDETFFYIEESNVDEIRAHFSLPYVYYCGAYTRCSCGFCFDYNDPDLEPDDDDKWGEQSVRELFEFLKLHSKTNQLFEIYSCWENDESIDTKSTVSIDLNNFELGDSFEFADFELLKVKNSIHS